VFKFLTVIISVILAIAVLLLIFYFLPTETKLKTLQAVTGIVPETIKKQVEELVLTPPEKRAKILTELKNNLANAQNIIAEKITDAVKPEEAKNKLAAIIKKAEDLIQELESRNEDASVTNVITSKLADKLIGEIKNNELKNPPNCEPAKN